MQHPRLLFRVLALAAVGAAPSLSAVAADKSPAPVTAEWNLRLRHEHVEDEAFAEQADALTLRVRAGLRFRMGEQFSALLEGEGITHPGDDFNSGANGQLDRPLVPDAEGAEINQAWLGWKGSKLQATLGRQRLLFDNQRWIGNSGWRQNEQTFDAAAFEVLPRPDLSLRYAWLDRVHRVNGDEARDPLARERSLDSHLFNAGWKHGSQQWTGYAWLHEDRDVAVASTATFGVRSVTQRVKDGQGWGLALEWAQQREHADNPLDFSHRYWLVEPSLVRHGVTWRAGWEHLGGDGRHALQAPLGTLHAFNGWADKFLTTPPGGLEDRYLAAGGKFGEAKFDWQVAWHAFRADSGGDYGQEWDASLAFPVHGAVKGLVKLADYRTDGFARDTTKAWLQLEWVH